MAYGMDANTENCKLMTNSMNDFSADISMNSQKSEDVTIFKCLRATLCRNGTCSAEVRIRVASAMARLSRIWQCNTISFTCKFKLYKSLVTSIIPCGCETWTLLAGSQNQVHEETLLYLLLGAQDQ